MRSDVIGDQILLLADSLRGFFELIGEEFTVVVVGFSHLEQHVRIDMFGSDLQMSADMMLGKFLNVFGR